MLSGRPRLRAGLVHLLATAEFPAVCRRNVLFGGAAAAASAVGVCRVQPAAAAAAVLQPASAMSREDAVARALSRVPVFVVANKEGLPYLTETNKAGKRSGSIYVGLREAAALLEAVRVYDGNATLAVVPLSSVFATAAKSAAELERQVATAPQPDDSGSMDMRLFRLRPLADETPEVAREVASVPGSLPLFYEPNLFITVEGEQRRPYFFRLTDLEGTWARRPGARDAAAAAAPSVRVLGLERLLAQLEGGEAAVEPILMPASETAELVKGRTLSNKVSQPRERK